MKAAGLPIRVQALCPGYTYSEFHDVLGVDRGKISKSMWMTAEYVVDASLRALDRGKLFAIPGWRYKAIVILLRLLPRKFLQFLALRAGSRFRRDISRH